MSAFAAHDAGLSAGRKPCKENQPEPQSRPQQEATNMTPRRADRPPDDDEPQLSDDDIRWIHEQRKLDAHAEWLRGQVRVLYPWVISIVGAIVAAVVWIKEHVRW